MPISVVYTNSRIALTKDPVFGVCVMSEDGWIAVSMLSDDERAMCRRLVDNDPACPREIRDALQ